MGDGTGPGVVLEGVGVGVGIEQDVGQEEIERGDGEVGVGSEVSKRDCIGRINCRQVELVLNHHPSNHLHHGSIKHLEGLHQHMKGCFLGVDIADIGVGAVVQEPKDHFNAALRIKVDGCTHGHQVSIARGGFNEVDVFVIDEVVLEGGKQVTRAGKTRATPS